MICVKHWCFHMSLHIVCFDIGLAEMKIQQLWYPILGVQSVVLIKCMWGNNVWRYHTYMETHLEQFKHCRNDALTQCRISETVLTLMCDMQMKQGAVSYNYIFVVFCGPGSIVGIATGYGLDGTGIESQWGRDFPHLSRPAPGAHPASCTMGTGSFPAVKSGWGVTLTPHPLLVPWLWKGRAIPLLPLWAIWPVQSQFLYKAALFVMF
jgi:hypothetical protein